MGIDYSLYIGPYARCKVGEVMVSETIRTCSNADCVLYKDTGIGFRKFCSECGSQVKDRQVPAIGLVVDVEDLRDEINDRLVTPSGSDFCDWMQKNKTHVWISNITNVKGLYWSSDPTCDTSLTVMDPDVIFKEVTVFRQFFQKELTVIEKAYGKDNFSIEWGVINYIH